MLRSSVHSRGLHNNIDIIIRDILQSLYNKIFGSSPRMSLRGLKLKQNILRKTTVGCYVEDTYKEKGLATPLA